jgi:hypothetical protein
MSRVEPAGGPHTWLGTTSCRHKRSATMAIRRSAAAPVVDLPPPSHPTHVATSEQAVPWIKRRYWADPEDLFRVLSGVVVSQ